ncbi:hypothetical protein EYC84_010190 [Monilinia fructicola]|uniref:Uncharacterized protein n=1 Tax=Monilinia fructicola TaxID=38448 RepID=A0A5M9JFM6_MONFR|nr:hypothetical protein EYC84_010190 [Monilinia fructicola]
MIKERRLETSQVGVQVQPWARMLRWGILKMDFTRRGQIIGRELVERLLRSLVSLIMFILDGVAPISERMV